MSLGIPVVFLNVTHLLGLNGGTFSFRHSADTFLIVGSEEEGRHIPLEFKQPKGSGKNNIYNQFNEASGQAKRLVVDRTRSPQSYESVCKQAHDGLMRRKDFTDVHVVNHEEITHYSRN